MKKIGPCRIVREFSANAYEIEFPEGIGISPIFNVADIGVCVGVALIIIDMIFLESKRNK